MIVTPTETFRALKDELTHRKAYILKQINGSKRKVASYESYPNDAKEKLKRQEEELKRVEAVLHSLNLVKAGG